VAGVTLFALDGLGEPARAVHVVVGADVAKHLIAHAHGHVALAGLTELVFEADVTALPLEIAAVGGDREQLALAFAVSVSGHVAVAVSGRFAISVSGRVAVAVSGRVAVAISGRVAVSVSGRVAVSGLACGRAHAGRADQARVAGLVGETLAPGRAGRALAGARVVEAPDNRGQTKADEKNPGIASHRRTLLPRRAQHGQAQPQHPTHQIHPAAVLA